MQAVRLEAVHELALKEVPKPQPGPGELLVRIEATGVADLIGTSSMAISRARRQ